MHMKVGINMKIGIIGYGNLGKGVQMAIAKQNDMSLFGVFTRRDPKTVSADGATVYHYDDLLKYKDEIDVLIHCGSSEYDLREQTPQLAEHFNIVDSFDIHPIIKDHLEAVERVAKNHKTTAIISVGWDPGLFSVNKTIFDAILPDGETMGFYGPGMSQGASNVAMQVEGVKYARNYAYPNEDNVKEFKNFNAVDVSKNHKRVLYVVKDDAYTEADIEAKIMASENYFKGSGTLIKFISEDKMIKEHSGWQQAGRIIRRAKTSDANTQIVELSVTLDSNPEFTASNLVANARAAFKMNQRQEYGGFTSLDVRATDLSSKSREALILEML